MVTKDQALKKIKHYCSYQDRCHSEVRETLYKYGLRKADLEELIAELIENDYLNEERFAIYFAGGKFRIKHWGRKKIEYELQQKKVSSFIIKTALQKIDHMQYIETLQKLAEVKWLSLSGEHPSSRQAKTFSYLLQKGFETTLINDSINNIRSQKKNA